MIIPFCPSCGANVESGKRFCENCGAPLTPAPASVPVPPPPAPPQYSPPPPACIIPPQVPSQQKSAGLAAVASFICAGLGQVYNGRFGKGLLVLFGMIIGSMIFLVPGLIVWVYGIWDAYSTAKKMNEGQIPFVPHNTLHMIAFIAIVVILVIISFAIMAAMTAVMSSSYSPYYY